MKKGLIITGGRAPSRALLERECAWADGIICADSGFDVLKGCSDKLCLVIGDLDSTEERARMESSGVKVEKLSPQKNETDTEMAILQMLEKEPESIHILGATGSRLDHSLATILSLEAYIDASPTITMMDECNELILAGPGSYRISRGGFKYLSLIPLTDAVEVSSQGLYYEVEHTQLLRKKTRGVSNEIVSDPATITLHQGRAFIIKSKDK